MNQRLLLSALFFLIAVTSVHANKGEQVKYQLKQTFEIATVAFRAGEYGQAADLYEKAIKIFPGFAPAHYYLGMSKKKLKAREQDVIPHFEKALEIQSNYFEAHEELARSYYALGNFDKAEKHGLLALKINPNSITTELTLGWTYLMGKSEADEAIDYFQSALEKQKISYAYLGLGMAYYMTNQRAQVLEMVTFLRQSGKEDLAKQLEAMIRDPSLAPRNIPGQPLFQPSVKRDSQIVREPPPSQYPTVTGNQRYENMPVRLSAPAPSQNNQQPIGLSGAERIRQLQERQSKGSY